MRTKRLRHDSLTRRLDLTVPRLAPCGAWILLASAFLVACHPTEPQDRDVILPPPALDVSPSGDGTLQVAVLAGGCFWGVEAVFEHVRGVESVVSGYAGGSAESASYDEVTTGLTGHAESVEVRFDPRVVSYGKLLQIFFSVAHDPTQINAQYPDIGPQYRSVVFSRDDEQQEVARAYIAQLAAAGVFRARIATRVDPLERFYPAESEHQDYLPNHLGEPYIIFYDLPRLERLKRLFPELYRGSLA
jgi:peptide-methionine (S)-S-oxide reductase